ncbi:MAG: hypothetical protein HUK22_07530, partial [Thermoguttaceae bacterium]|nr:hypothetical protein [Thermoguttaceae bacterium]
MGAGKKYSDYFIVDDAYYPVFDPRTKENEAQWNKTYPHETIVDIYDELGRILESHAPGGQTTKRKGLWIEGAYGTGKSRILYTIKRLLECDDAAFDAYFDEFAKEFSQKRGVRERLAAQRRRGKIVAAFETGTGSITHTQFVIRTFNGLTKALKDAGCQFVGQTLRSRIADWLDDGANAEFFRSKINVSAHRNAGALAGKTTQDIAAQLRNPRRDTNELVEVLLKIGEEAGVTAFRFDMQSLCDWIEEVIKENDLAALVMIWDEFSSYFRINGRCLDQLQDLAQLSARAPFHLIIATHESGSLHESEFGRVEAKKIKDRFQTKEVELPDGVAFRLMNKATTVKEEYREEWETLREDL